MTPADGILGPLFPLNLADLEIEGNDLQTGVNSLNQAQAIEIVQPPPEMTTMLYRTARFIARRGSRFERRIMASNVDNAIFNFLKSSDPYHAFYQQKVAEYRAQPANSDTQPDDLRVPCQPQRLLKFKLPLPEGMTSKELNTVRLTAYFAAQYGKSLLLDLVKSVIMYPQFGFLKPTDRRFNYFTQLVDAYSLLLMPPTSLFERKAKIECC